MEMSRAKAENKALPKRFYKEAKAEGGRILLDGKELKTSGRNPLNINNARLAQAVAAEWNAQETHIDPTSMPLTRLLNIAIDRVPEDREQLVQSLIYYGETDLTCYRADDPRLSERQRHLFDPVLEWAKSIGIVCHVTQGVMPIAQPSASLKRLEELLREADDYELAALSLVTPLLGSVLLALALWKNRLSIEESLKAARLDEDFQAEQYQPDTEEIAAWETKAKDIRAAAFFLDTQAYDKTR